MLKIAALLWIVVGTVLAGIVLTAILAVPGLLELDPRIIPVFCGAAFLLAMPAAYFIAKKIAPAAA